MFTLTEEDHELINRVMDNFDTRKVQKIMEVLDWRWVNTDERNPQYYEIAKSARRLLKEAVLNGKTKSDPYDVACGGLYAEYNEGFLTLQFISESSDYDSEWLKGEPKF